jgi:hypothetical protein
MKSGTLIPSHCSACATGFCRFWRGYSKTAYLTRSGSLTTDTQWRHKSKISEKLGRCGKQNMLWPYLKIWDWDWIFGRAVKAISSLGVRSSWSGSFVLFSTEKAKIARQILSFWPYCIFELSVMQIRNTPGQQQPILGLVRDPSYGNRATSMLLL